MVFFVEYYIVGNLKQTDYIRREIYKEKK